MDDNTQKTLNRPGEPVLEDTSSVDEAKLGVVSEDTIKGAEETKEEALIRPGEPNPNPTSPVEEKKLSEEVTKEPEAEDTRPGEPVAETGKDESKKGFSNRVRELNAKAKEAEEKVEVLEEKNKSLTETVRELTGSEEPSGQPQINPDIKPGDEVSLEKYQQDVVKAADGIVTLKLGQYKAVDRVNRQAEVALKKHPQLNPDNESFNKELSKSVAVAVEAHIKADPYKANVVKFVDTMMEPYNKAVTNEVDKATETLAKQVTSAAVKPTSVSNVGDKEFKDLSTKQMEDKLGVVH